MNFIQAVTHPDFISGRKWARIVGTPAEQSLKCDLYHNDIICAMESCWYSYGPEYPGLKPSELLLEWELIEPVQ